MTDENGAQPPRSAGADAGQLVAPSERDELEAVGLHDPVELARGGFGVVYRAEQPALQRRVAVKVMTAPVHDPKVRARFTRECQAMGLLSDHPGIVTVFDAGFTPSGRPYLVMELMTGGALAQRVQRDGAPEWPEVLRIGVTIAGALETAHRAGIVHRDVKPENILLSEYGEPKLGDFGIARLHGGTQTQTGTLTASIAHAAPELLTGDPPTPHSDLYALGSTLFALLAGRSAFVRDTDESIVPALARITTQPVPDLRPDGIPHAVCSVVERLMEKAPRNRFASAEAAGRAMQEAQAALGVEVTSLHVDGPARDTAEVAGAGAGSARVRRRAPPPAAPPSRRRRPAPRRRWLVAGVGVFILLALAAAIVRDRAPQAPATADTADQAIDLSTLVEQLGDIRGVRPETSLTARRLASAEYESAVRAWSVAGREDRIRNHGRVLAALHLLPADVDLVALTQDLAAEQFLGFYEPAGPQITVRADGAAATALERSILADETTGALLDAAFGTQAAITAASDADADAARALTAVLTGDTYLAASAWEERFLTDAERQQADADASALPDRLARSAPAAVRAELVFPFVAGERFVREVFERGGVRAIDRLYDQPPTTTEQILHPAAYFRGDQARPVALRGDPGDGWTPLTDRTFGEFDLRQLVAVLGAGQQQLAGTGWAGGRLTAWTMEEQTAVGIALTFDSRRDARQACRVVAEAYRRMAGATEAATTTSATVLESAIDALAMTCSGSDVHLAVAPDTRTALAVLGG